MVEQSYKDFLQDILDAMNKAQSFVSGMEYKVFKNDDKTAYAVIRALEVIGEETKACAEQSPSEISGCPMARYGRHEGCPNSCLFWC